MLSWPRPPKPFRSCLSPEPRTYQPQARPAPWKQAGPWQTHKSVSSLQFLLKQNSIVGVFTVQRRLLAINELLHAVDATQEKDSGTNRAFDQHCQVAARRHGQDYA